MRPRTARATTGLSFGAGLLDPEPTVTSPESAANPYRDEDVPSEAEPIGIDPEDGNGPRCLLAEWIDREAAKYPALGTTCGDSLARQLNELARLVRWTGAATPADHEARMEVYEAELRARWEAIGFEAGTRDCRCGECTVD